MEESEQTEVEAEDKKKKMEAAVRQTKEKMREWKRQNPYTSEKYVDEEGYLDSGEEGHVVFCGEADIPGTSEVVDVVVHNDIELTTRRNIDLFIDSLPHCMPAMAMGLPKKVGGQRNTMLCFCPLSKAMKPWRRMFIPDIVVPDDYACSYGDYARVGFERHLQTPESYEIMHRACHEFLKIVSPDYNEVVHDREMI